MFITTDLIQIDHAAVPGPQGTPCVLPNGRPGFAVFCGESVWGDPCPCASLAEIEAGIRSVCESNPSDFQFPEGGLVEGIDWYVRIFDQFGNEVDEEGDEYFPARRNPLL